MYRRYLVYMSDVKQVAGGISSPHSELISVLCDDLEGFDQGAGGGFPREGVCVCVCVCVSVCMANSLLYSRNECIVKQF